MHIMSTVKSTPNGGEIERSAISASVFKTTKFRKKLPTKEVIIKVSAVLLG